MLRPQVRLVLLIQALGLRACNTPGRGERGHLELQHLPREPQPHWGPRVAEQDTELPQEGPREGKAPPHWCLMLAVGIHSGARPCGKAKMPSLVSSLSPPLQEGNGWLRDQAGCQGATVVEAPVVATITRLLSEPQPYPLSP